MSVEQLVTQFSDAESLVNLARVAEQAERYEDMCKFMKALVEKKQDLSVEERNLLSVAYKNVVGSRRASWRTLNIDDSQDKDLIGTYKNQVEGELADICREVLELLKGQLLPQVEGQANESEVFYQKMTGDYFRYLAEFKADDENAANSARDHYQKALDLAKANLAETHPTRLGLALNYSVCYYEILKKPEKACSLAKEAFDAAIQQLDSLTDSSYKDSTLIMQLLRDNLTLWTSEAETTGDDQAVQVEDVED